MNHDPRAFVLVVATGGICLTGALAKEDSILVSPDGPRPPDEQAAAFVLPEGFSLSLFAAEPDINKPMNMAFDARGRLWVTTTVEYPYAAPADRAGRDRIVVLEDTTGDGRADRQTTFADGLNIPTGILPDPDGRGCIAWSIPNIWRFEDTDGDGVSDRRTKLYGPLGFENDVHGMSSSYRRGPDGWVYTTHGFNNESTFRGADGSEVSVHSGNTVRVRPDGSRVELVSRGQVNPFGICFDRLGYLFSVDCHSRPVYNLIAGGSYPSFGKPHDGLGFAPEMIAHSHGSTGIAGVVVLDDLRWPEGYRDHLLIGNPVTGTLNRDAITWAGASPTAVEQPDFLTSDDGWFRPVDLQLGPDGALYVADFYNCIIGHYEVPLDHPRRDRERGRIWRIAPEALASSRPPDLTAWEPARLLAALGDGNITVRQLARALLEQRGVALPAPELASADASERVHALRALAEEPAWPEAARQRVEDALADGDPHVRRAAAAALAALPAPRSLDALLAAARAVPAEDDHTLYTLRVALRNLFQASPAVVAGLPPDPIVASVMPACPTPEAAGYLFRFLASSEGELPGDAESRYLRHAVAQVGREGQVPATIDLIRRRAGGNGARFVRLLVTAHEASPDAYREPALEFARESLQSDAPGAGLELIASARLHELRPELVALASDEGRPASIRLHAARVLAGSGGSESGTDGGVWTGAPALAELVRTAAGSDQRDIAVALASGSDLLFRLVEAGVLPLAVLQDPLVLQKLEPGARERAHHLTVGLPPRSEALAARIRTLAETYPGAGAGTDLALGQEVFLNHCAACHRYAAAGAETGVLGPALDGIGARGAARLLEDILDPSRQVDPAFQIETLTLENGEILAGLVRSEDASTNTLLLASPAGGEPAVVPLDQVRSRQPTPLSLMPATFADALGDEQVHALLAYLAASR